MDDLKYRVEELELDGDDLRRRVDKLEDDDFVDPDEFENLEYRVRKLEKADWRAWLERKETGDAADPETTVLIDPDNFDALVRRVKELENVDLRARLEALELETRALRDRLAKLEGETK
ncbi:MAG: hypothetical protein IIW01_02540 [Thermoguttaceae bacterium]|nr:hypothetical protein [Thermoguttaceae bacterium]